MVSTVRKGCAAADRKQRLISDDNASVVIVRQKEHVQRETGGVLRRRQAIHTASASREPPLVTVCSATCCLPVFQFVIVSFIHHVTAFIHFIHVRSLLGSVGLFFGESYLLHLFIKF